MFWIRQPREIVFGYGSLKELPRLIEPPVLVVTGGSRTRRLVERLVEPVLGEAGIGYAVTSIPSGEPTVSVVEDLSRRMLEAKPRTILAVGGGSVIDASKAAWIFYENPELDVREELRRIYRNPFTAPPLRRKARLVVAETTSGTGSGISRASVITDEELGVKMPVLDYQLAPDASVYDPELTLTMPPKVTASTGMDAITHALEAYVARGSNDYAETMALRSLEIAFRALPKAYANGGDRDAREAMHLANMYAALAFSQKGTGLAHSISHVLGAMFKIPHGALNAAVLPFVVDYNAVAVEERYADVALAIGLSFDTVEEGVVELIYALERLVERLGLALLPDLLEDKVEELSKNLDVVVKKVLEDPTARSNPRRPTPDDVRNLLSWALEGEYRFYAYHLH